MIHYLILPHNVLVSTGQNLSSITYYILCLFKGDQRFRPVEQKSTKLHNKGQKNNDIKICDSFTKL